MQAIKDYKEFAETPERGEIKALRSDGGGEYPLSEFIKFAKKEKMKLV